MAPKKSQKTRPTTPLQEVDDAARRRLEDLPDQPQEHVVRGYGAMNPIEGELEGEGGKGEEGTGRRGEKAD